MNNINNNCIFAVFMLLRNLHTKIFLLRLPKFLKIVPAGNSVFKSI